LGNFDIVEILITLPAVLVALTLHELAHGWTAWMLGDPTAKQRGRLTLNPLKHIDILGMLCMVLLRFGWAKPVPVDPRYFRHPRRDMAIVAAAGPAVNLVLGFFGVLVFYLMAVLFPDAAFANALGEFFAILAVLSVGFAVFNLIPLPPLDGSRIIGMVLPPKWNYFMYKYERYIQLGVIALLYFGVLTVPLSAVRGFILGGMEGFVRWIVL
jgi:Zn-dependent protease